MIMDAGLQPVILLASLIVLLLLYITVRKRSQFSRMDRMTGEEFEEWCAAGFRKIGYDAVVTKASGDYGVDILLYKRRLIGRSKRPYAAVQAKCYSGKVGVAAVQQAAAGKAYYKAKTAMVATNSTYTKPAIELAQANGVRLLDGSLLERLFAKEVSL